MERRRRGPAGKQHIHVTLESAPASEAQRLRRDGLVAYATALGVLVSLVVGAATASVNYLTMRVNAETLLQQAATQRASQFTTAVEQLGSRDQTKGADVRLGGVYSMERLIDADPATYRAQGCAVLGSFINNHAPINPKPGVADPVVESDVRGAFSSVARECSGTHPLAGPAIDLRNRYLAWVNLASVDFSNAYLMDADLVRADLTGADLSGAYLNGASFRQANLTGAKMTGAEISTASFYRANLSSVDLSGLTLRAENLKAVQTDEKTVWPKGFTR